MHNECRATRAVLASRLFTRAGDQVWDFALPVTLAILLPNRLGLVVFLFLASKSATIVLPPRLAATVDWWPRIRTVRLGTALQVAGVVAASAGVASVIASGDRAFPCLGEAFALPIVVVGSVASSLESGLMEIAVGNDWIPSVGLYGFGLGETEIRQSSIPDGVPGVVNGFASSLTSAATLLLFALGAAFSSRGGFVILVSISVVSVVAAFGLYWRWSRACASDASTRGGGTSCSS